MAYTYANISLNINKRKILVNPDKYKNYMEMCENRIATLPDTQTFKWRIEKNFLDWEYQEYLKYLENGQQMTERKITIGSLLDDSFTYIINAGLANYDQPWLNIFNFSERLDLALAITFDSNYTQIHEKLMDICKKKNIDLTTLSMIVMESEDNFNTGLTLIELMYLAPEISEFISNLVITKDKENMSMIDLVDPNVKFSEYLNVSSERELTAAIRLKIRTSLVNVIHKLIVDFYTYRPAGKGIVFSQYMSGVTFNSANACDDQSMYCYIKGEKVYIPCRSIQLWEV